MLATPLQMPDDLPPQFREPTRPEQVLYDELPVEPPDVPAETPSEELPPRSPEPFLRRS
jgi:hypothetical protein